MNLVQSVSQAKGNQTMQKMVNWFVFFMAFPAINLLDNSITFYFFIYFVVNLGFFWHRDFFGKKVFFTLMLIIVLSSIFAPYSEMPRYRGFFFTLQIVTQYIYWILTSAFFIIYRRSLNMYEISKWVFYGLVLFTIGFYLVDIHFSFGVGTFGTKASRNAFVFNMLCCIPISFYYLKERYGIKRMPYFIAGAIAVLLLTNGRSGGIIIMLEGLAISAILFPSWLKVLKQLIIPIIALFFLFQSDSFQPILNKVSYKLASINPRLASLLTGSTSEGNLRMDRSWLERKLQVDKGIEIIGKHPWLGVGTGNFSSYDASLNTYDSYERLGYAKKEYFNKRSSHNSYIQILGEFGILGFIPFMLMILIPVSAFIKNVFDGNLGIEHLPLVSCIGMSLHFYAITAITGSIAWLVFGLAFVAASTTAKKWF